MHNWQIWTTSPRLKFSQSLTHDILHRKPTHFLRHYCCILTWLQLSLFVAFHLRLCCSQQTLLVPTRGPLPRSTLEERKISNCIEIYILLSRDIGPYLFLSPRIPLIHLQKLTLTFYLTENGPKTSQCSTMRTSRHTTRQQYSRKRYPLHLYWITMLIILNRIFVFLSITHLKREVS